MAADLTDLNEMTIANGGTVSHPDRHLAGLVLNVLATLAVEDDGLIDLDALGLNGGNHGSIFGADGEAFNATGGIDRGASAGSGGAGASYAGEGANGSGWALSIKVRGGEVGGGDDRRYRSRAVMKSACVHCRLSLADYGGGRRLS